MISSCAMPSKKKAPEKDVSYAVGDRVKVNMHRSRIVEAEIKAVIKKTHGVRPVLGISFDMQFPVELTSTLTRHSPPSRRTEIVCLQPIFL